MLTNQVTVSLLWIDINRREISFLTMYTVHSQNFELCEGTVHCTLAKFMKNVLLTTDLL